MVLVWCMLCVGKWNDGEGWGKKTKTIYTDQNAWKSSCKPEWKQKTQEKLSPFSWAIKLHVKLIRLGKRDQFKKAMCPTHPTGKEGTYSGLPGEKGELLVEHLKVTSLGIMALFDLLKHTILKHFLYCQPRSTKYWRHSVLNTLSDAINYKFTPLREITIPPPPSPASYLEYFSLCL